MRNLASRFTAALLLAMLMPLMLATALSIQASSPGPVFFRQLRVGRDGTPFSMWKLRTMVPDAERRLNTLIETDPSARAEWEAYGRLASDPRVAGAGGRFARRFSVDELPQLFNVVGGQMGLVGPRPLLPQQALAMPADVRATRESVRPGLTGLWQVSGRSEMTLRQMSRFDLLYVKRRSLWLDLNLLWRTPKAVVGARGAY